MILDTTAIPEMRSAILMSFRIRQSQYSVYSQTVAVLEMGSFVSVVSSAALMQKYEIRLYLLSAARELIVVLW